MGYNKRYIDNDGNTFELTTYPYKKGDAACVGCAFKFGNSEACRRAPSCTPNNPSTMRLYNETSPPFPEWIGKHLVWRIKN